MVHILIYIHIVRVQKSLKKGPRLKYYAKTKSVCSAETTSMQGSTILQNGNLRQRYTGLLIGNWGISLEGLGHLKLHWWVLGSDRSAFLCHDLLTVG